MENNIIYGKSPDSTLGLFDLYLLSALTKQKMVKTYDKSNFSHDFIENPKNELIWTNIWKTFDILLNARKDQEPTSK